MRRERILILFGADSRLGWGPSCRLARAFVKNGHEVLHIDFPRRLWEQTDTAEESWEGGGGVLWESLKGLPVGKLPSLTLPNCKLIKWQVDSILAKHGFSPTVLWLYGPYAPLTVAHLKTVHSPKWTVYDCADDRPGLAFRLGGAHASARVEGVEKKIMRLADVTYCVSPGLCEKKSASVPGAVVRLLPNGIDEERFKPASLPIPADVAPLPGRKVGYVGSVNWWLDMELVARCAKRYPEYSFYFAGPSDADLSPVNGLSNVHILGPKPFSEVDAYVSAADLLFNPIKDVAFTRYCHSMKILQYVAMGKPVIAMDFAGSDDYFGLVRQTSDPEEFLRMLGETPENPASREERRSEFARQFSWTEIARSALERLPELGAVV